MKVKLKNTINWQQDYNTMNDDRKRQVRMKEQKKGTGRENEKRKNVQIAMVKMGIRLKAKQTFLPSLTKLLGMSFD